MRTFAIIMLAAAVMGCSPHASAPRSSGQSFESVIDEARALAIARQAVATNDTWVDRAVFKATREGSGWSVWVWREPRTPGGDRTVLIDEKGKVTAYYRGE
jgi:Tfp pilus assembly protein FimT